MGKRANGEGTIIQLKNGKWKAVVSVGFDSKGKRIRKSKTHDKKADAVASLRNMCANLTLQIYEAGKMTVGECLESWLLNVVRVSCAQNTIISYERVVQKHLIPLIGHIPLRQFAPAHVQKLIADLVNAGKGARSRQLAFVVLSACMNNLVQLEQIQVNPCKTMFRPKYERKRIRPFEIVQAKQLLAATAGKRTHALLYLALSTGMRQGELLGLHWEQIDFRKKTLLVDRQAIDSKSGSTSISTPKTKVSIRELALSNDAIVVLKAHQKLLKRDGFRDSLIVFPSATGGFQGKSNFINKFWNRLLVSNEIKPARGFHHLRHTYATLALGAGVPVHVVSKILGHSSPSVTWNTYAHVLKQDQAEARDTMSKLLGGCLVVPVLKDE